MSSAVSTQTHERRLFSPKLRVKLLTPEAKAPTRAGDDVGYDLYTVNSGTVPANGKVVTVGTGISVEIPKGHYGRVAPRSGLSVKKDLHVAAGVIDPGYRGPVKVAVYITGDRDHDYAKGDRIAQLIIEKCATPDIELVDSLSDTIRGSGGFGSTGF